MWLSSCKQTSFSCTQVNDNILELKDLLEQVLNGVFNLNLPAAFKKIKDPAKTAAVDENKQAAAGNDEKGNGSNRRKRKNENGNGNLVKNKTQDKDTVPKEGKTWKDTFSKQFMQDMPPWDGKVKMAHQGQLLRQLCQSHQPHHQGQDPSRQEFRLPHNYEEMPWSRKDKQLTAWVGAQRHLTTKKTA
jgi:hypothetical protein